MPDSSICPRCGVMTLDSVKTHNALSRVDNKTYICSPCGMNEAVECLSGNLKPKSKWAHAKEV